MSHHDILLWPQTGARARRRAASGWHAAQLPTELRLYALGGHSFGMRKQGLPVDGWIDRFSDWLQQQENQ